MAHLVIVVCDRCQRDGERVEATEEITVAFNFKKPRRMDLCAEHAKTYVELREFAETVGVTLRDPSDTVVLNATCPQCGRQFKDRRGLGTHIRMGHDVSGPVPCPECGRVMKNDQGLANHRAQVHQVPYGRAAAEPEEVAGRGRNGATD